MKQPPRVKKKPAPQSYLRDDANLGMQLTVNGLECAFYVNDVAIEGFGPNLVLLLKKAGRLPTTLDLTEFNYDEIVLLKQVFDRVFELALPVVKGRDEKAEELSRDEHVPMRRLTRAIPRIVESKRLIGVDGESLLQRPKTVSDDDESDDDQ